MYFEIYRQVLGNRGKGQWRWRLKAGNHEIVASGEAYVNKADCLHAIDLMRSLTDETRVKEL